MPAPRHKTPRQKALSLLQRAYQAQLAGQIDRARELYRASLTCHPTAEAWTFLGWTYSLGGDFERAIAMCRRAIATDPGLGNPYNDLGSYLVQLQRYHEATFWLRKAAGARRYLCTWSAHFNLGRIFECLGDELKALEAYRLSVKLCPECEQIRIAYLRLIVKNN